MIPEVIAECASNHGGSVELAKEFIDMFAPYVDTMKFQMTRVAHLRRADPQFEWFKRAELTLDQFGELKEHCHRQGVEFLVTVYNAADVWEVVKLGCRRVKIGSGEANEQALLHALYANAVYPIISCGLKDQSKGPRGWSPRTKYLGCCSRYPAPHGIAAALCLHGGYDGWSDHARGLEELYAAIAVGASIVETHVRHPKQARQPQVWEKTVGDMQALRAFADDNLTRFIGRWQA